MHQVKIILFLTLITLLGCSSDKGDASPDQGPGVFKVDVNGEELFSSGGFLVYKTENSIEINDSFRFTKDGRFASFSLDLYNNTTGQQNRFSSYREFSSHYFDFYLESVDEVHKRVKGTFSGYLYDNYTNLNSESKFVSGFFNLPYQDLVPAVIGLGNHAKINGVDWSRNRKVQSPDYNQQSYYLYFIQEDRSNDEYKMNIYLHHNTSVGTYNFTNASASNKILLSRFDPVSTTYIDYICTGTMNITESEQRIFSANYNYTAVNPNDPSDIIQVTDGAFKLTDMQ